jgi:hypothetical protein
MRTACDVGVRWGVTRRPRQRRGRRVDAAEDDDRDDLVTGRAALRHWPGNDTDRDGR